MKRFHGSKVGALAVHVYVCKVCGGWQLDHRGNPTKPTFFCDATRECNGTEFHHFPSKGEARAYASLKLRERMGEIRDIELQPIFRLHAISPDGSKIFIGKYLADFGYTEISTGTRKVSDSKGSADTHLSAWKRKHAESEYGITIAIVQI